MQIWGGGGGEEHALLAGTLYKIASHHHATSSQLVCKLLYSYNYIGDGKQESTRTANGVEVKPLCWSKVEL